MVDSTMYKHIYLSVVLSTYNDEKYIAESIRSILDQTYPYFEFIIVNDGSTDGTLEIIKTFKDERIVLIDKPNSGLSDSLNIGISKAKYEWIARMDGDDIALPNRFEEEVKMIEKGYTLIGGQVIDIDGSGNKISGVSNLPTSNFLLRQCLKCMLSQTVHPTSIYKKEDFLAVGGYDALLFGAEDYDMWTKLASIAGSKFANLKIPVLMYRMHGNNISVTKRERQSKLTKVILVKSAMGINHCLSENEFGLLLNVIDNSLFMKLIVNVSKKSTHSNFIHKVNVATWMLLSAIYYSYLSIPCVRRRKMQVYQNQ